MKKVFTDYSEITHRWANKLQDEAKHPQNRMFFRDNVIYSYGHHFPIAAHFKKGKKQEIVIFTTRTYSNTTAKHVSEVRSAVSHLTKVYCPHVTDAMVGQHEMNLKSFDQEALSILLKLEKAKKPEIYLSQLERIKATFREYVEYFDVTKKELKPLQFVTKEIMGKGDAQTAIQKLVEFEKKQAIKAKRQAEMKRIEDIRKFRTLEIDRYYNPFNGNETLLRLNGENVETSKGIKFSKQIAKRILGSLRRIKTGETPLEGVKILDYPLIKCDEKEIEIGCHEIQWTEIEMIAEKIKD